MRLLTESPPAAASPNAMLRNQPSSFSASPSHLQTLYGSMCAHASASTHGTRILSADRHGRRGLTQRLHRTRTAALLCFESPRHRARSAPVNRGPLEGEISVVRTLAELTFAVLAALSLESCSSGAGAASERWRLRVTAPDGSFVGGLVLEVTAEHSLMSWIRSTADRRANR